MADFKNTIDVLGDDAVIDSIINRTIPEYKDDAISKVEMYAFYKCTALEMLDVPNAEYLANFSFSGCTALKTVNIPNVPTLGDSVFYGCGALESVTAPKLVTLNSSGFRDCKALRSVNFPALETMNGASNFASCTALERADFAKLSAIKGGTQFNNCNALTALILRNTASVVTLASAGSVPNTTYIYVPTALQAQYAVASNWSSHADRLRKLEEWTVDGTVTGELATNRHMVRFFNSDGTLLGYKIVTTGSSATWDGATPVNPNGEDPFTGFDPDPVNVTADMDCYAQYVDPYAVQWEAVFASINAGTYATDYAVGDTVPLNLGSEGVINMQIAAFDSDVLADGSGNAPITWIAQELLEVSGYYNKGLITNDDGTYQEGSGSIGGWEKSNIRNNRLKGYFMPLIPIYVRDNIKVVTKTQTSRTTTGGTETQTTQDDVWIPSQAEVVGSSSMYYGLFHNTDDRRVKRNLIGTVYPWWLRDAYQGQYCRIINDSGTLSYAKTNTRSYFCLGFCT